jgi:pyridoxal phosphate enzyme (YggS family)
VVDLKADRVRANLAEIRARIEATGRPPGEVRVLAATKYVPLEQLRVLADAGLTLIGENRAQDLVAKFDAYGERFEWHFIGVLQSRKVKVIAPLVTLIHSLASESALRALTRHARPGLEALIEVNVAGDERKAGIDPTRLDWFIENCPVPVAGLMTMPPEGGDNRRWFAALRELADARGLRELSMGTTQDFETAVEEGATIVRIGTSLYR